MKLLDYVNKYSDESNVNNEVVIFGIKMIRDLIISAIVAFIVGILFDKVIETIFFLIILIPLRQNAGGFHTKGRLSCGFLSLIILIGVLSFIGRFNLNGWIQLLLCTISLIIIFVFAPVDNVNNELDNIEKKVYKERTRKILLFELLVFMVLFILDINYWSQIIITAFFITSILLLMGYIENIIIGLN